MTFFQSDLHNMRRDNGMMVLQQDIDLVVDKFEVNKAFIESFYYLILRNELGIVIFL